MNHAELKDKFRKAFGKGKIPISAKPSWAEFVRSEATQFYFNYDWIKDQRFYEFIYANNELDFMDGSEGMLVGIMNEPHECPKDKRCEVCGREVR